MLTMLMDLLNIESFSKHESEVAKYIKNKLNNNYIVTEDEVGNVYCVNKKHKNSKKFVLLNAHMDSVKGYNAQASYYDDYGYTDNYNYSAQRQKMLYYKKSESSMVFTEMIQTKDAHPHSCILCKDFYTCYSYKSADILTVDEIEWYKKELREDALQCSSNVGRAIVKNELKVEKKKFTLNYDEKTKKITSNGTRPMGGDDKCGIAIAMQLAMTLDLPIKLFFSVQEEIGCIGVKYAIENNQDFFEDCMYSITCDRKGGTDICVTTGGEQNANNYFIAEMAKWGIITGVPITLAAGTSSDNFYIKKITKNAINLSAGYYSPHTNYEYVMYNEVKMVYRWVKNFITKGDFVEKNFEMEE